MTEELIKLNVNQENKDESHSERQGNYIQITPEDEIKFFLREYKQIEGEKNDFYYLMPLEWFRKWEAFVLNPK